MSMQTMTAFLEKAQSDEQMGEQLVAIIDENEAEVIFPKVVALANDNGFTITVDDVKEVRAQFTRAAESNDGDLSDEDLENVSGGIGLAIVTALIGSAVSAAGAGVGSGPSTIGSALSRSSNRAIQDVGSFFQKW